MATRQRVIKSREGCDICGCTFKRPCVNEARGITCRQFKFTTQGQCNFCTQPSLRKPPNFLKPRLTVQKPPELKERNLEYVRLFRAYRVTIYVRATSTQPGYVDRTLFYVRQHRSRLDAREAALSFRDEMRELMGLPFLPRVLVNVEVKPVSIQVFVNTHAINPSLPEGSGFMLEEPGSDFRRLIRAKLADVQEREDANARERERQRVKPNHDGVSRAKAEIDAFAQGVSERGLHSSAAHFRGNRQTGKRKGKR